MAKSSSNYPRARYARYRAPVVDRINLFSFLRRSLRMFRSRWWIALLTTLLGGGLATYFAMTRPDVYRAVSRLGIAPRVAFAQRSTDRAVVMEEKNSFVADQLEYMRGALVIGKVEEKMQDFRLPDNTVPTKTLLATPGPGSTFIMRVESANLEYARRFARHWAQEFLAYKEELRNTVARRIMDKTRTDLSRQEERVTEARQNLDNFLQEHQIATSQDTGNAAQALLQATQGRKQQVSMERTRLELRSSEQLADDASQLVVIPNAPAVAAASDPRSGSSEPVVDRGDPLEKFGGASNYRALKVRLNLLDAEIVRLSADLKPKHPHMVRLAETRASLEQEIKGQLDIIEEARLARISSLRQEEGVLEKQEQTQRAEVQRLREISRDYEKKQQEYQAEKQVLDRLSQDLQALTSMQSNDEVITVLDEGVGDDRPIAPDRPRMIIMGVLLGFVAGIGLIFLLHKLDDRIESAEDLERVLDEPILGQLPFVSRKDLDRDGMVSVERLETNNIFVEALRGVRSSIMFGELGGSKQVLMATSSVPGDGKSTFTVNFAITLANAGNRVLLVDGDMRRGTVGAYFGLPSSPGLSEVLNGMESWQDVLNGTKHRSLLVITSGKSVTNPGELLLSKGIKRFIEEVRRDFDYVIFDCPPVIGMDDASSLANSCDGLVFVYRVGITSLKLAKLAVNTVRQRGGKILGLILNGVSINNPDYYYTAYYYSHYTYTRAPRALPETVPTEPQPRPKGASLLQALREAEQPVASRASSVDALLDGEPGTVDVQETTPPEDSGGGPRPTSGS